MGGGQHSVVLNARNDQAFGRGAEYCKVIGFGAAAGEDHLLRLGIDQGRHRGARLLDHAARGAAGGLDR